MWRVTLTDDAEPRIEWDTEGREILSLRCRGPAGKFDPHDEGAPGYKLRDRNGRKGYVREEDVVHIQPF